MTLIFAISRTGPSRMYFTIFCIIALAGVGKSKGEDCDFICCEDKYEDCVGDSEEAWKRFGKCEEERIECQGEDFSILKLI